jgi:septum formation protein
MSNLILASTSRYRRELLNRLGLDFDCVSPGVDEDAYKSLCLAPLALAETLAQAKAEAVFARYPIATVIGSDQLVSFDGQVLGKPGTPEKAVAQLLAMSDKDHQLITSLAVTDPSGTETFTDITTLRIRPLSYDEAARYVAADAPLDCAGSYKIETLGITLFDRIDSQDHTAIIGLPLIAVSKMLRKRGFVLP